MDVKKNPAAHPHINSYRFGTGFEPDRSRWTVPLTGHSEQEIRGKTYVLYMRGAPELTGRLQVFFVNITLEYSSFFFFLCHCPVSRRLDRCGIRTRNLRTIVWVPLSLQISPLSVQSHSFSKMQILNLLFLLLVNKFHKKTDRCNAG